MFKPGQGPRISPYARGFQGWFLSLTNLVEVFFSGPGGGPALRDSSKGIIRSNSASESPAREPYDGNARVVEDNARATVARKVRRAIMHDQIVGIRRLHTPILYS